MGYVGIDVENAGVLVAALRSAASTAATARSLVADAAFLADVPAPCVVALDGIEQDFIHLANRIEWAVSMVMEFRLNLHELAERPVTPQPVRTPVPEMAPASPGPLDVAHGRGRAAQWNAGPASALNDVRQVASHNSYVVPGGVDVLYEQGVRAFEIDIHHHPPLLATPRMRTDSMAPDWSVYHVLGWSHREYETLSQGLAAIASLDSSDPVTVFIDNKDDFGAVHTGDAFDQVLRDELGELLFTPGDLLSGSAGSASLLAAVQRDGWPTIEQLQGRVIVVLTDNIEGYDGTDRLAFVAERPSFAAAPGGVVHEPRADAVFYNADARRISQPEIEAVHATGTLLRTYFNRRCAEQIFGQDATEPNYRAVDVAVDGSICESRVIVPPTPVPGPG